MTEPFDKRGIATRIRGLVAGQDHGDLSATARRLHVDEVAFRITVDELAPHPTLDTIVAVVRFYGVDPTWLLTGEYDGATHRLAIEADEAAIRRAMVDMLFDSGRDADDGSVLRFPMRAQG